MIAHLETKYDLNIVDGYAYPTVDKIPPRMLFFHMDCELMAKQP